MRDKKRRNDAEKQRNKEVKMEKSKEAEKEKKSKDADGQKEKPVENEAQTIERQKQEYQVLWEQYLRLQADFDNYKKRSLQDKADFIKFANQGLISELIGILDNFELSIKYADQKNDFKLMHQGVDMIIKQLHTLLKAKGLEKIKTLGESFDPHYHDALEIIEDESVDCEKVVEEFQPGYLLSGKILRTAKVKVAKPKTKEKQESDKEELLESKQNENQQQEKTEDKQQEDEVGGKE